MAIGRLSPVELSACKAKVLALFGCWAPRQPNLSKAAKFFWTKLLANYLYTAR